MKAVARVSITLLVAIATFYFVFWLPLWLFVPGARSPVLRTAGSLIGALAVGRYVWQRWSAEPPRGSLAGHVVAGAAMTGLAGFVLGFVGPMVFAPGANQGPLLGILLTGPLGVVGGAVGGAVVWFRKEIPCQQTAGPASRRG